MKNNFKHFILWGSLLLPSLLIFNMVLFRIFLPQENCFLSLAASILVSWLLMLTLYYVWAIYFYNINQGWTDQDWQDYKEKVLIEGAAKEPDGNPNSEETLGLPAGTVRGTIALTVLVIGLATFVASFGLPSKLYPNELLIDHFEFLKTAFLMVIAFYFGSKSLDILKNKQSKEVATTGPSSTPATDAASTLPVTATPSTVNQVVGDVATDVKSATDFDDPTAKG